MSTPTTGTSRGSKRRVLVLALLGVLLVAGGAAGVGAVMAGSEPASAAVEEVELVPGEVVALEPVSVNLADGRYLRFALALQAVASEEKGEGGSAGPDGSKALDLAIKEFSGRTMGELNDPVARQSIQDDLLGKIMVAYEQEVEDGEAGEHEEAVMAVYFTQFVMQ